MFIDEKVLKLRLIIIGLGSIGRRHLYNVNSLFPDANIGIFRPTLRFQEPIADDNVIFRSLDEALKWDPHGVIICTPASTHCEFATPFLKLGIPVFIEKPISVSFKEAQKMAAICPNPQVLVGYNLRFNWSLLKAKQLLEMGAVGQVLTVKVEVGQYLPSWRPGGDYRNSVSAKKHLGGGVILELSHELDLIYWLFGLPDQVVAVGGAFGPLELDDDVEDMAAIILKYEAAPYLVTIGLDFYQQPPGRSCKFVGSEGTLIWDYMENEVALFSVESGGWKRYRSNETSDKNHMYRRELLHFVDCVTGKVPPLCSVHDACNVLALVEAIRVSIARDTVVRMEDVC